MHSLTDIKNLGRDFFIQNYWSNQGRAARDYVTARGISPSLAQRAQIGYAPNHNSLLKFLNKKGISSELGLKSGLLSQTKNGQGVKDFYYDYVIFPVQRDNETYMFASRKIPQKDNRGINHLFTRSTRKIPYNMDVLNNPSAEYIFLVESVFNALSLTEWGYHAIATLGNSNLSGLSSSFKGKNIIIAYDMDANGSGQKATLRTAKQLYETADVNSYIINMPIGVDINDYYRAKTLSQFQDEILYHKVRFSETPEFEKWQTEMLKNQQRARTLSNEFNNRKTRANSVPIERVVREICNVDISNVGINKVAICPRPDHNESSGSYVVYTKTNSVKCFGCNFFGKPVSVVSDLLGVSYTRAMTIIEDHFNLGEFDGRKHKHKRN